MTSVAVMGRVDLPDAQWARLAPLLPPTQAARQSIDVDETTAHRRDPAADTGRVGSPWRDMPPQYGPWQAIYFLFRRWQCAGTRGFILKMPAGIRRGERRHRLAG
ncbi:transposase [Nocardia sp. X0981]